MQVNVRKLKGKMVESGVSANALANAIGMNESTFYRKIQADGLTFTIGQIHGIVDKLGLSKDDAIDIFLQ